MKKFTLKDNKWALALLVSLSLVVNACGDGDDDDDDFGGPAPTATNTRTTAPTNTPGGPTNTPGGAATPTRTPGGSNPEGLADVEAIISSILPTLATFSEFGSFAGGGAGAGSGGQIPGISVPCTAGGTLAPSCSGNQLVITFNDCRMGIVGGPSVFIDGSFAVSTSGGSCFAPNPNGTQTIDFEGTVETTNPKTDEPISLSFDLVFTNTFNGSTVSSDIDGTVQTACVGEVTIETREPIVSSVGASCPTGGLIFVATSNVEALVRYTSGGGLEIDLDADASVDETFGSCLDADSGDC